MAKTYLQRKQQISDIQHEQSIAGRDIGAIPPVVDPDRREDCRQDFRLFCETYFTAVFALAWSPDHLKVISIIENAVLSGGLFAVAMPRGSGKTSLATCAGVWALLYGHRSFVVLIGASEDAATDLLDNIKADFETNDLLGEDFPEVTYPIRMLEGMTQRTKGQHIDGERTKIEWTAKQLALPIVAGSASSGAVVKVAGITGRVRGMQVKRPTDGATIRPDFVVIDDPQTDESAHSPQQVRKRLNTVNSSILGLAGPGKKIAGVMPITVIAKGDMADQVLDRKEHPEWQGQRIKLMRSMPKNEKLWEQYAEIRANGLRAEKGIAEATAFYVANQDAMDEGAEASWAERFNPDEASAVQYAMNLKLTSEEAFAAEYQNEPLSLEIETPLLLKPEQVTKKISDIKRGVVPDWATKLTAFIDVQGSILFYVVCAWGNDFTGHVIDYGTYPKQARSNFTLREISRSLSQAHPKMSREGTLRRGLEVLTADLLDKTWLRQDGKPMTISRLMVDSGWDDGSGVVKQFCKDSKHRALLLPSKGFGKGPESRPLNEWTPKVGERAGWNWRVTPDHCLYDTNNWKTFVASNLLLSAAEPGNISLFNDQAVKHQMFAAHVTSEYPTVVEANGRSMNVWRKRPNTENHFLDCLIGCAMAASEQGILAVGHLPATGDQKKKRKKFNVKL